MSDRDCFVTMKRWMENNNRGKGIADYLSACGYGRIAIYGAGDIGRLLYHDIKGSEIYVAYFADRNAESIGDIDGIKVVMPIDIGKQEEVDIMVVSPVGAFASISRMLVENYPQMPVLSLKDAVYETI